MCECGCSIGREMYTLPGVGRRVYLITLIRACVDCDGPSGVSIEKFDSEEALEKWAGELPPELPLEQWADNVGAMIVTGFRRHEFVAATKGNLVGIKSDDLVDKKGAGLDATAAEIIAEELYEDSNFCPRLVAGKTGEIT